MSNDLLFLPVKISDTQTAQSIMLGAEIGQSDNLMSQELEKTVDNGLSVDLIIAALLNDTEAIELLSGDIDGIIEPVSVLPTLPNAAYPQGSVVFLLSDNKLYRSTGTVWTKEVDGLDISLNSISTNQIVTGGLNASVLTAGTISGILIDGVAITAGSVYGTMFSTSLSGTGARIDIDSVNGLRSINSGGFTQVAISTGGSLIQVVDIRPIGTGATSGVLIQNGDLSASLRMREYLSVVSGGNESRIASNGFVGAGLGITSLDGSSISAGTVADARIVSTIARKSMGSENIIFASGFGIASGGASVELNDTADLVKLWANGAVVTEFGAGTKISVGGVLKTVNIDNLDLGTGFKDYVYLT